MSSYRPQRLICENVYYFKIFLYTTTDVWGRVNQIWILHYWNLDMQQNIKISKLNKQTQTFYLAIYLLLCSMSTSSSDYAVRFNSPLWFNKVIYKQLKQSPLHSSPKNMYVLFHNPKTLFKDTEAWLWSRIIWVTQQVFLFSIKQAQNPRW